jgi:CRISPR-associated protein Cmr5
MQTRDQKYASDAFDRVTKIAQERTKSFGKAYGSMAHKLPILIHVSGLAQALAFVASRGEGKGSERLLEDLSQTVLGEPAARLLERSRGSNHEGSLREYIYLTEQILAALLWYKRYAQSILNVEQGEEEENESDGGSKE